MSQLAIKAENISKQYRLGKVGTGTLSHDLNRLWYKVRGLEDPYIKIGEANDRSSKGDSEYVWSLRDINFEIEQGDAVGIIGRNGAGKSTLLKLLSKVTKPTTGGFKVNGRIASLLEVGTGFNPEMSGRENIYLNGAILGMRRAEITRKLDEIIDFSGVERYIDTPVKRYSSGMYVRLAFAVAAHLESEILIVDEVLAVGDAEFQKKCLGKMNDVSKGEGRTVLFVSHNMAAIQNLCKKGMLLEQGMLIDSGNIERVVDSYMVLNSKDVTNIYTPDVNLPLEVLDFKIINSKQNQINKIISGQYLEFVIEYQNFTQEEVSLAIGIYDLNDVPLVLCNSKFIGTYFEEKGKQTARLIIEKFPLLAGSYYLNLEIKGTKNERRHISKFTHIDVENGDFYKTGQVPDWKKGILIDFNWK
jgi:lipopolysaccharide transport system ATP-binding protein